MDIKYQRSGDYLFPNLLIKEKPASYGKYGMLRRTFLREHRKGWYQSLLLSGKLEDHLLEIDRAADDRVARIVEQFAAAENISEQLKAEDPLLWAVKMSSIRQRAEEIVLHELVFC